MTRKKEGVCAAWMPSLSRDTDVVGRMVVELEQEIGGDPPGRIGEVGPE